jgi:hypothetical protein
MRIPYFILSLLCCGLIAACNSDDPKFPLEETLTSELMPLQGITNPMRIEVSHPYLILQNRQRSDSLFHIYDLTNYELNSAFGVVGRGPGEFVSPWLFQTPLSDILIENSGNDFGVSQFGIDRDGQPIFKGSKQPNYIDGAANAAFINDSLYVIDAMYLAPSLFLLTFEDELPRKTRQFRNPNIVDFFADPDMGRVYANDSRIALCYGWKKQIDFMDIDLNLIKRVKFNFDNPSIITPENEQDVNRSYTLGYFGKRYLYVVFWGASQREYISSYRGAYLEVYDLNGNPVVRYHFDGINPGDFVVDEVTFTLYGTGGGKIADNLVVYKLKGLS